MVTLYKIGNNITVCDDVTMITISNVFGNKRIMSDIFNKIISMQMYVEIVDYHSNYKGDNLTIIVENSGILRVMSAVGMFKEKASDILCDIYCFNTAITFKSKKSPAEDAASLMSIFAKNNIELYHLYSSKTSVTIVVNETYTDEVCKIIENFHKTII